MNISKITVPSKESTVCLACGFCCQGILFPYAGLQQHERELADQLGLCVDRGPGKYRFQLPCPCYLNGRCSVYFCQRPVVCAGYRCQLLRRYSQGVITYEEAIHIVKNVNDVMRSISSHGNGLFDFSRSLSAQIKQIMARQHEDTAFRQTYAPLLIELAKLYHLLNQYFYPQNTEGSDLPDC